MTMIDRRAFVAATGAAGLAACAPEGKKEAKPAAKSAGWQDATALAAMIRSGEISAAEVIDAAIRRAEKVDPKVNFLVAATFQSAREKASAAIEGPFAGVPTLIKDLDDQVGAPTRRGSRATEDLPLPEHQKPFIDAVFAAGVVSIGKSATPEEGYLPTTEPLAFGPTCNPWDLERSVGGSSGGAAAAVAAGVVPVAEASDGGGSIRIPSSQCGVFGLKPSRRRMIGDVASGAPVDLSVKHCVSRTVRDSAGLFAATEKSGAGAAFAAVGFVERAAPRPLRAGVLTRTFSGLDADVDVAAAVIEAAKLMETLGHRVEETAWPVDRAFVDAFFNYWALGALEDVETAAARLGRAADETMFEPFTLEMAREAKALSPDVRAASITTLVAAQEAYDEWLSGLDVVLSPVMRTPAAPLGYYRGDIPIDTLRERLVDDVGYTMLHNAAGAPSMSVPLGMSAGGLPIGVQAAAAVGAERTLFELAYALEEAAPWVGRRPAAWVD